MADGLQGLGDEVLIGQVRALLLNRRPDLLDASASPIEHDLYVQAVSGISTEVAAVVGQNVTGSKRETAVWAITLGVAHLIEAALFPEQQLGDFSRAEVLRRRYEAVLALLERQNADTGVVPAVGPLGSFPPPVAYPDPALNYGIRKDPRPGWHG